MKASAIGVTAIAALFTAYTHGVTVASAGYEAKIAKADAARASAAVVLQAQVVADEHARQANIAAIDAQHQQDIANEKINSDRIIADLRSGAIRLRDKFSATSGASAGLPGAAANAGLDHAAQGIQLQDEDAGFLIRFASDADQVADQLRACQAVVRADRADTSSVP